MVAECVFCRIGQGEIPGSFLYKDDRVFVTRDINPKAPTHLLVIPFEHITCLSSSNVEVEIVLGRMVAVAIRMAEGEDLWRSGYRLVVNQGLDSGQEIPHVHLHLLAGHKLGTMG